MSEKFEKDYQSGAKRVAAKYLLPWKSRIEECYFFLQENTCHFQKIGNKKAATSAVRNLKNIMDIIGCLEYEVEEKI